MPFMNDPSRPVDRVRMRVGDVNTANEHLADAWYDYYLSISGGSESSAAVKAAGAILASFTENIRERVDQVEIYGNHQFENYLKFLQELIRNPSIAGMGPPMPYAGGISKSDMDKNKSDPDANLCPVSQGFNEDSFVGSFQE